MARLFGREWTREELRRRVGDMAQIAGIRLAELSDGKGRGVRVADVDTGTGFRFTVLIDRAMDIGPASLDGRSITWYSGPGIVHPAYYGPEGTEWLRSFPGGLLSLCGLAASGAATAEDEWGGHGLHGRISNTPGYDISVGQGWEEDAYVLWIQGRARETAVFGVDLTLTRRITTRAGESRLWVHDAIENTGFLPAPLMLLYHCNFGFPLVDAGSRIILDDIGVRPRDAVSAAGMGHQLEIDAPTAGYQEQCFYHDIRPDAEGYARAAIVNPNLDAGAGLGAYVRYRKAELPYLVEWKQMGAGTYVVGLEPGNSLPEGRKREQEQGRLQIVEPGQMVRVELEFGAVRGKDAVAALAT